MADNRKNLKPQAHVLTLEEQSQGGKRSAEVRAEKKAYRELARDVLAMDVTSKSLVKELKAFGIEDKSVKALTLLGLIKAAANGSHYAFDRLLELAGEKGEKPSDESFDKGKKTLADMINNPAENRSIADFEGSEND